MDDDKIVRDSIQINTINKMVAYLEKSPRGFNSPVIIVIPEVHKELKVMKIPSVEDIAPKLKPLKRKMTSVHKLNRAERRQRKHANKNIIC